MQRRSSGFAEKGPIRRENQDLFLVDDDHGIYAVADGMGGTPDGGAASALAIATLAEARQSFARSADRAGVLRQVFEDANRQIFTRLSRHGETSGTTLVALALDDRGATIAHAGDSRCYRLRHRIGAIEQLTADHNLAHELGSDDPMNRHLLTNAVGIDRSVKVTLLEPDLQDGDRFLLCTDGVYSSLDDSVLKAILAGDPDPAAAARALRSALLARAPEDNVCAVIVAVGHL